MTLHCYRLHAIALLAQLVLHTIVNARTLLCTILCRYKQELYRGFNWLNSFTFCFTSGEHVNGNTYCCIARTTPRNCGDHSW